MNSRAPVLLLVAGFVDAIAFIYLQANFVSFMSGNTTVLGVSPSLGHWSDVGVCAALIGLFFAGVFVGSMINRTRTRPRVWLLWSVLGGLTLGATLATFEPGVGVDTGVSGAGTAGMLVVAVATGMINAVFEKDATVPYGLTYVTGTLVMAARQLADTVTSGERRGAGLGRWAWLISLGMWSLLAVGALLGGYCFRWFSLLALWIPAAVMVPLALSSSLGNDARRTG